MHVVKSDQMKRSLSGGLKKIKNFKPAAIKVVAVANEGRSHKDVLTNNLDPYLD